LPSPNVSPLCALCVLAAGLVCALASVPQDVEPSTALRAPVLWMTLGIVGPVAVAVVRNPKALLRAEYVVIVSPVFWLLLDPIQGRYDLPGVSPEDAQRSLLAIGLFLSGVWFAVVPDPWQAPKWVRSVARLELSSATWFIAGVIAFSIAFLRFAIPSNFDVPEMLAALGRGRWEAPWSRGELGGTDAILDHLSYFGFVLPALTVMLARRVSWWDIRTVTLLILTAIIALFLGQSGGRRIVGVLFGSAAALWFLSQQRITLRPIIALALSMICLIMVLEMMLDYRNMGWVAYFDPQVREEVQLAKENERALVRVDDNFLRLAQITSLFPDSHPYVTWRYLLWVAVRPVPRFLWPEKPTDPGFILPELVSVEGATLSASTVGELFATGGFLAVFLGGLLYGRLAGMLSSVLQESYHECAVLIYSLGLLALFVGMRSIIELVLMSYAIIACVIIVRFMQIWSRQKAHILRRQL
jgi:hypothetical protein